MLEWDIILCHIRHELRMSHYWYVKSWILFYIRETNLYILICESQTHKYIHKKKFTWIYSQKKFTWIYSQRVLNKETMSWNTNSLFSNVRGNIILKKKSIMLICYILIKINKIRNKGWRKLSSLHLLIGTKK